MRRLENGDPVGTSLPTTLNSHPSTSSPLLELLSCVPARAPASAPAPAHAHASLPLILFVLVRLLPAPVLARACVPAVSHTHAHAPVLFLFLPTHPSTLPTFAPPTLPSPSPHSPLTLPSLPPPRLAPSHHSAHPAHLARPSQAETPAAPSPTTSPASDLSMVGKYSNPSMPLALAQCCSVGGSMAIVPTLYIVPTLSTSAHCGAHVDSPVRLCPLCSPCASTRFTRDDCLSRCACSARRVAGPRFVGIRSPLRATSAAKRCTRL